MNLESFPTRIAPGNDVVGDFSAPPSFHLPNLNDFNHGFIPMADPSTGATTVAFVFNEGVMVAVDSRACFGGTISSLCLKKFLEINPHIIGTMSGGTADWQFWHTNLVIKCRLHELANKTKISVSKASKLVENICFSYRGRGLSLATIIAGWDEKGPRLYFVAERGRFKATRFCVGSGSRYAHRVLNSSYRSDMSVEEASELARRAIYHATFRDGASGGVASVVYVGPNGWKNLSGDDVRVWREMVEAAAP